MTKNAPRRARQKAKPRSNYHLKGKTRQKYDATPLHKGEVSGSEREGLSVTRGTLQTFYTRIGRRGLNTRALALLYDGG